MLRYLITSATRRRLLALLWAQGQSGTVAELARRAGVAFAGAHRELQGMQAAGLVEHVPGEGRLIYRANLSHPMADTLKDLLRQSTSPSAESDQAARVREALAGLGAPLRVFDARKPHRSSEDVLMDGCKLARNDASVARALPVVLAKRQFDLAKLLGAARRAGEKHSVGFFLELAGRLSNDDELVAAAQTLKDRRRTRMQPFFPLKSEFDRRLAESRTPEVARRWGWLMNMGLDSFEETYRKQVSHGAT